MINTIKNQSRTVVQSLKGWLVVCAGLLLIFFLQQFGQWEQWGAVRPHAWGNIPAGLLYPLLHTSLAHWFANSVGLIVLGTVAFSSYPKASVRAVGCAWIVSYAVIWVLGSSHSAHMGASGLVYGLIGFLMGMGLFRRDVKSILIAGAVLLMYGGAWVAATPFVDGVSWQGHLGGLIGGLLGAKVWRSLDQPPTPRVI